MEPVINDENEENADTDQDRTDGEDSTTTPSQSRSPSVHPVEDDSVDVFDGYSFKGRHSVILDDEDEDGDGEDEEDEEDEESVSGPSLDDLLPDELGTSTKPDVEEVSVPEDVGEPKTPEARPTTLPVEVEAPPAVVSKPEAATPRTSQEQAPATTISSAEAAAAAAATRTAEDANVKTAPKVRPTKQGRNRREKSGIPALDKDLPDTATEDEGATEREEDEDDWDFVEAGGMLVEERNGAKGTSLFARGVVDRYKLAVFRKSTPRRSTPRSFSGLSLESDITGSEVSGSPTPSDKRRGRTPGLTFRKHPKQFLRQKSPPPSTRSAKSLAHSTSATLSAASTVSSAGLLTPSQSQTAMTPSLKSKESAISMGTPSDTSDHSLNGDLGGDTIKGSMVTPATNGEEEKQQKNKVLKKYKEAGEKVLSIFQSPR